MDDTMKPSPVPDTELGHMYQDYYLDYASYVILDRAIPRIEDGLKPVQRRILHALQKMDDGRFNKVANVIGFTMQFHPHGDASIGEALVGLGQKDHFIETQGNWGNVLTGDSAAAPRYIEARLSKLAREVVFHKDLTEWQDSYDGRNQEPVVLPIRYPILLAQGAEGIAVGLATKILPHNAAELLEACIAHLQGKSFTLFPDFPSGGEADVSQYQDGRRGGKIRHRAVIEVKSAKELHISEIPFGTTTVQLMESIVAANDKGKIKIKKVEDNTAADVDIIVHLPQGADAQRTREALFAFTACEVSISPNACVIENQRPRFMGVSDLLKHSAERTRSLLREELEVRRNVLEEKVFFKRLERLFIEKKIYQVLENCKSLNEMQVKLRKSFHPYLKELARPIEDKDLEALTEIRIRRISRYDAEQSNKAVAELEAELDQVLKHLKQMTRYTVGFYKALLKDFGKHWQRKTRFSDFGVVDKKVVAHASNRLYVNIKDGFIGTSLRRETFLCECSDMEEFLCIAQDGILKVVRPAPKVFVGKNILHVEAFVRGDERTVYNIVYRDGRMGSVYCKRVVISSVTREREYDLTKGTKGSKILYLSVQDIGDPADSIAVETKTKTGRPKKITLDFDEMSVKKRDAVGQVVCHTPVVKIHESG